ncbi:MAG: lytic transglycosylase domain-containing protein [Nitrospiraceae bacterium]|nr:lytic transglycosylase domain-containing protein [Nitrospiraceae bacterium]
MRAIVVLIAAVLLYASPSSADIYRYVDENGVVCYTDSPMGKKTVRVLREKKLSGRPELSGGPQRPAEGRDYSTYVQQAATKYEIEPDLIKAVIKTESNGNHRAVSRKGAMGLMQLMPSTANDMNVVNPFNPEENIEGGTRYLRSLLEKFNGDLTLALAAYNAGPKTVEKYRSVPPISETRQYVRKIMALFKGKGNYSFTSAAQENATPQPVPIYRVVLDDGTVLFTNSSYTKTGKVRF